jgi:S1/P1 Nuclease
MPHIEAVKRQATTKALVLFLAAVLLLPGRALAWGSEGHHISTEIAEQFLEASTVRQVRELLAIDNETTLAQASTWADEIRPQRPETARWHYVNIPINPPDGTPATYDPRRDCPSGDCVVEKIGAFEAVLRDKSAPPRQRLSVLSTRQVCPNRTMGECSATSILWQVSQMHLNRSDDPASHRPLCQPKPRRRGGLFIRRERTARHAGSDQCVVRGKSVRLIYGRMG